MVSEYKVSVVMSVYDKPADVRRTIQSVLAQEGVGLEFVVVSDGASQEVLSIVESFSDDRLKLVSQTNQGLTVALINGCREASHEFIARIDAGDEMLKGRLSKQAEALALDQRAGFVTCGVEFYTDEGHFLYHVLEHAGELQVALSSRKREQFRSPVHASMMFKKSAYVDVGEYRPEFYFAQDCDLWARMVQSYKLIVLPEMLQRCTFSASGLSGRYRQQQNELANLVAQANALRAENKDEWELLQAAKSIRPSASKNGEQDAFEGLYFIASTLSNTQPKAALLYWRKVFALRPFSLKARAKWAHCRFKALF